MNESCKKVYNFIKTNIFGYDAIYITNNALSKRLCLCERVISVSIKYLIDNGFLEYYVLGGKAKAYCLPDAEEKDVLNCKVIYK